MLVTVAVVATVVAVVAAAAVDTAVVGSSVHEEKVPPPADLLTAAAGDTGYHHTHKTRGGDGYKHFDSFHKKDGDSFGYEKHSAYGKGDQGDGGGEYHEASSYSSDDGDKRAQPKVWHYESRSGTPSDPSYDPETYEGDYTQLAPRATPPDAEVVGPLDTRRYQVLKAARRPGEPQTAGTEDAEYYYDGSSEDEGEGDGGSYYEGEYEGGDYEGEGDYYY